MITAHTKGHPIYYENGWRYETSNILVKEDDILECPECGQKSMNCHPDPCIGVLPNTKSACCGHGKEKGYIING